MSLEIRPHPHRGVHDVQALYRDGKLIGWCGKEPGRPLSFIYRQSEAQEAEAAEFVTAHVGLPSGHSMPPVIASWEAQPDDDDDEVIGDDDE